MTQWYLGVDVGTTGISAALLHRQTQKIYPIYWQAEQTELSEVEDIPFTFRLPSQVYYLDPHQDTTQGLVQRFKPLLNLAIPYDKSTDSPELIGLPIIQWSEQQTLPLRGFRQAWTALLSTLHPGRVRSDHRIYPGRSPNRGTAPLIALPNLYTVGAVGLDAVEFQQGLNCLDGVVLGCSTASTDAYRFNLREAVLAAGIVQHPEQIFIIEDAIATLLYQFYLHPPDPNSTILIINIGATTTEIAVAKLPQDLTEFTASQVVCTHLAYAGDALNQDIITQLLIQSQGSPFPEFYIRDLEFPQPGHPDLVKRYRLKQILHSDPAGLKLLEIAETLKFELQQRDRYTLTLNNHAWEISQKDLEPKIFIPFIQQLNQELNHLFSDQGISPIRITQAICTGGNGTWPTLSRWLRQKLPNALITQDSPHAQYNSDNNYSHCSRLAWGLALLPLYFPVLDLSRHQYSDYFLLAELLRVFKEQPLSLSEVYQLLENRGVNTRSVSERIRAILKGKLPSGLIPSPSDTIWLTVESQNHPDYQGLLEGSLFYQDVDNNYFLSLDRADLTRKYLAQLSLNSLQNWEEPLISYHLISYQLSVKKIKS
ncbi:MAG: hypothetical protein AUK43_05800 [Oscillatoriales cyanobacterium CG2_30_40_61]|nr:MAG: hypothetical protein AUK43_05800 [Oscillatoriales cyanobacterium CG2_30_40_61]